MSNLGNKTAIIFLTKNEENTIGGLIDELKSILKSLPKVRAKIFICDDSKDKTRNIAKQKGVEIIKGKDSLALSYYFALYSLSKSNEFENIITIDGDGQTDLSEFSFFYEALYQGYDLIVGSRFLQKNLISYNYLMMNFIGVKILSFVITFCTFQKFTDSHGGLRGMKNSVAKNIKFLGTHSYVQESIITAKEKGFKIKELPTKWRKREFGESRVLSSKWIYIKKMSGVLLLRMRVHYLFLIIAFISLFIFNHQNFYKILIALFPLSEFYKVYTYRKNRQKIEKEYG
ncbi:MAG: glycosyltransferase family 2 protein [Bdellovibrionales bacterium]|nr:glycosyltransferase family 2 protein [Bdellovibrionales bacterium]